jgi:hypothetical protein
MVPAYTQLEIGVQYRCVSVGCRTDPYPICNGTSYQTLLDHISFHAILLDICFNFSYAGDDISTVGYEVWSKADEILNGNALRTSYSTQQ